MKKQRTPASLVMLLIILLASALTAHAQKKVILGGLYSNTNLLPSTMVSHIGKLQDKPFDGLILSLKLYNPTVFTKAYWDESALTPEMTALQQMHWGRYTDNFLVVSSAADIDWFNDAEWASVLFNIGLVARAARVGQCKGIVLDPESYPSTASPWCYNLQPQHTTKSYNDYRAIVRRRGAEFLQAIKQELPNPVIFCYYGYDYFFYKKLNPNVNSTLLSNDLLGLLPEFLNGMLDAATPGTTLIDGNEESYYYTTAAEYANARTRIASTNKQYAAPNLAASYPLYLRNGAALFPDYVFNQFTSKFTWRPLYSKFLSSTEKNLWWEHNAYHALSTTEQYVWLYAERADFVNNVNIPFGLLAGLTRARQKVAAGQPLGFTIDGFMNKVKKRFH